nr:hypothetical protein [Rhizobium sp. WYCCWR 11152]
MVVTLSLLGKRDSANDLELVFVCFEQDFHRRNFRVRYEVSRYQTRIDLARRRVRARDRSTFDLKARAGAGELGDHRFAHGDLQTQCRRSADLSDRHAHCHRQWSQAEPYR